MADDKLIKSLKRRFEQAKTERDNVRPLLEELGKYVWPAMQDMLIPVSIPDEGTVMTVDVYDSTAMKAATKMTSGVFSYLMPIGSKWFIFEPEDYEDSQDPDIKLYSSKATVATHKRIWRSNYLREMWQTIKSLVSFGTACISYDKKKEFRMHPIQFIFFEENSSGKPDAVFKHITFNRRQAIQEFENPGKSVTDESEDSTKKFEFIHCCVPNADYDGKLGSKKYASIYINLEDEVEVYLKNSGGRGGFNKQYYNIARMPKGPSGIMGEAPGKDMLPDIKMLNSMQESFAQATEWSALPTTVVSDDGVLGQPVIGGGGFITMRAGAEKPYLLSPNADLNAIAAYIKEKQQDIRDGFFNKIFTPLEDVKNISSATEALERVNEELGLAAPLITPLNQEILDPMFLQVYESVPAEELPPKPDNLKFKIAYKGRLALAMGKLEAQAGESWLAKWSPLQELTAAGGKPVLDNIDIDGLARDSALEDGIPAERLIPVDNVKEIRDARSQQAGIAQGVDIAETASKALKNVGSIGA